MADQKLTIVITAKDLASRTLQSIDKQAKSFGATMSKAMQQATAESKKFAMITAGVATGIGFLGKSALQTAAQLEQEEQAFKTLLGSAEEAREAINMIKKDAAETPFELPGLIRANKLLTAVTKDAGKSEKILLDVGKALSAVGGGQAELDRIIVNLQQIGSVGKASMLDIKQFAFAGIPIFEMLQEELQVTGEELGDMISDGKVSFDVLEKMFAGAAEEGGRFANAFKDQAGTFNQLVSNMKDSFVIFGAEFVRSIGLFDFMKDAIKGVIDVMVRLSQVDIKQWLSDNEDLIRKIAGGIAGALTPAVIALTFSFGKMIATLAPFITIGVLVADNLDLIEAKMNELGISTEFMIGIWETMKEAAITIFTGIKDFFVENQDLIRTVFMTTWRAIKFVIETTWNFIKDQILPIIQSIFETIQFWVVVFKEIWQENMFGVRDITAIVWEGIKETITVIWEIISSIIKAGLALLRGDWSVAWEEMGDIFNVFWETIKAIATIGMEGLRIIWEAAWDGIKNFFVSVVETIEAIWDATIGKITRSIQSVVQGVKDVKSAAGNIVEGIGEKVLGVVEPLIFAKGGIVPQYLAGGGFSRGTDTVPAMLTPGELVLNKAQQENLGNQLNNNITINVSADSTSNANMIAEKVSQVLQRQLEKESLGSI